MPELPEVETIKRDLEQSILGKKIHDVIVYDSLVVNGPPKQFINHLKGKIIKSVSRRSKALIIHFETEEYLVVHLKMTGQLILGDNLRETQKLKDTKVVFHLSDGTCINYNDQRRFGLLSFVKSLDTIGYFQNLGPEPLTGDFNADWLKENLKKRNSPIKPLLMNQQFVSGIGNIYASEILFEAGINPKKQAGRLKDKDIKSLYSATRKVLQEAIELRGSSMRNYRDASGQKGDFINRINVYAREGEDCPSCAKPINKIVQAGRSTFYCKKCQK